MAIYFSAASQIVTFSIPPKSTTIVQNVGGNILNMHFFARSGKLPKFKFFTSRYLLMQVKFTLHCKRFLTSGNWRKRITVQLNDSPKIFKLFKHSIAVSCNISLTLIPKHPHEIDKVNDNK